MARVVQKTTFRLLVKDRVIREAFQRMQENIDILQEQIDVLETKQTEYETRIKALES